MFSVSRNDESGLGLPFLSVTTCPLAFRSGLSTVTLAYPNALLSNTFE